MDCNSLGSAAFVVVDNLEAELLFRVAVGLDGSGFLGAEDIVVVVGFLATAVEGGRLTSDQKRNKVHSFNETINNKTFVILNIS